MMRLARLCLCLALALFPLRAVAAAHMALVIGMADYRNITALENTRNDARAVGNTLEGIGFDVRRITDATQAELQAALDQFAFDSQVADVALVYFAGHGVELDGVNYLVPIDVAPRTPEDIKQQSVTLKDMLDSVDKARRIRIVILDACRDNPFSDEISQSVSPAGTTDATQAEPAAGGLAPAEPDPDTLVVFAARDGQVAYDGTGENSPFATALIQAFAEPGLEIGLMFRRVRDLVRSQTGNRQQPFTYGSLSSESVYFIPPADRPVVNVPASTEIALDDFEQIVAMADASDDSMATRSMKRVAKVFLDDTDRARFDPAKGVAYLERAAEAGDPEAMWQLAIFHEKGIHVPVDEARALELFRASADLGYDKALNDLGFMYSQGLLGLTPDQTRAFQLFEQAAKARHPQALFNFAVLIDQGVVPRRTPADAAGYLFDAVRTGQKDVLNILCERPDMFTQPTRRAFQEIMKGYGFYTGAIDASFGTGTTRGIALAYGTPAEKISTTALANCNFD